VIVLIPAYLAAVAYALDIAISIFRNRADRAVCRLLLLSFTPEGRHGKTHLPGRDGIVYDAEKNSMLRRLIAK
jgi:hypothetical protein